jgi:GTPase KRas
MDDPSRITITICGDGGCGKSSITLRLVRSQWTSDYDPTIEDSYSITRRIDGQTYHLSLTDTAGQEEYRGMWGGANLRSDAFLMVYDITNADSLDQLEYFNELIDMETETRIDAAASAAKNNSKNAGQIVMPVKIVAGNKCDLQESRQVDAKTGLEWARRRSCGFMETSARNVVNIEETFALIVRRVVERRRAAVEMANGGRGGQGGQGAVQGPRLPREGLAFDVNALGGGLQSGIGTRRAVTAPLSPLPLPGDEKIMRLGRGPIGRPKGSSGFWGSLRCW